jgi:hypothetical protein
LLRLASNRSLWSVPLADAGRGAPRQQGEKFKLNDPHTWTASTQSLGEQQEIPADRGSDCQQTFTQAQNPLDASQLCDPSAKPYGQINQKYH